MSDLKKMVLSAKNVVPLCAFCTALIMLLIWAYLPGLADFWLFDDRAVIGAFPEVNVEEFLFTDFGIANISGGVFGRPVSMLTFAAEFQWFGKDPATSKSINLGLHISTGLLVLLVVSRLFKSAGYSGHLLGGTITAALWIYAPILVSTVLYPTQRMAILACLVMLLSVNLYLIARDAYLKSGRYYLPATFCLFLAALGVLSKENAACLPLILLLIELFWFQSYLSSDKRARSVFCVCAAFSIIAAIVGVLYCLHEWSVLMAGYNNRPFNLTDRLLTQPHVLMHYIHQFISPDISAMGINHDDFPISRSLTNSIEAMSMLLAISFLFIVVIFTRSKLAGRCFFCIGWFLVGHSIEASILPLELYFEHRNYFPLIGLAMLPCVLVEELSRRWSVLSAPLYSWLLLAVLVSAVNTGTLVRFWSSESLLKSFMLAGHPNSFRANLDGAVLMAAAGGVESAERLSKKAGEIGGEAAEDVFIRSLSLHCLARTGISDNVYRVRTEDFRFDRIDSASSLHQLITLIEKGKCRKTDVQRFSQHAYQEIVLADQLPRSIDLLNLFAFLEYHLKNPLWANEYTDLALSLNPEHVRSLLMKLHFSVSLDSREEARKVYSMLVRLQNDERLLGGDQRALAQYRRYMER